MMTKHERVCFCLNYNTGPNAAIGKCKFNSDGYQLLAERQVLSFMHSTKISKILMPSLLYGT